MTARQLTPGRIRRALDVVLALPPEALADLAERIVDRLDAAGLEPDAEPEEDACDGCDDFGSTSRSLNRLVRAIEGGRRAGAGDAGDAEDGEPAEDGGDDEPDRAGAGRHRFAGAPSAACWTGAHG